MGEAPRVSVPETIPDAQSESVSQIHHERFSFITSHILHGTYLKIIVHPIVRFNGRSASVFACVCSPNLAIPFREKERDPAHWLLKSHWSLDNSIDVRNKMQQKFRWKPPL